MKEIKVFEVLDNAAMSFEFPLFRKLLGYDPFIKFYAPNPEAELLCTRLAEELGIEMDETFTEFMKMTNGALIDVIEVLSFKNTENTMMDLLYVNLEKNIKQKIIDSPTALIACKFADSYYIYEKSSIINKDKSKGYLWSLYDVETKEFSYAFETFYELVEYHINLLQLSF